MARAIPCYSRTSVFFLLVIPLQVWGQLPDSPLRPSGQAPLIAPNPGSLNPGSLNPASLNPASANSPSLHSQSLNPTGANALAPNPSSLHLSGANSSAASALSPNPLASPPNPLGPNMGPNLGSGVGNSPLNPTLPGGTLPSVTALQPGGSLPSAASAPNPAFQNQEAIDRGVVTFSDPATFSANRNVPQDIQTVNYETEQADAGLSPMEQRYSAWWREVLQTANFPGQAVELKALLQNGRGTERVPMIREYWRLSEAIVAVHVHRESLETWQRATAAQAQQPMARTLVEILQLQIEQANATVVAEQEHLGLWLQRLGLPQQPRPVDAPFLGLYDTKLSQLQPQGGATELGDLAQQVDQRKQDVLDDEQVVDWADQEWERARTSGDLQRMATMIQLRQSAYLLWLSRVTRYNEAIAQYAFRVAGSNVPVPQQLAMLLRQPIVDGRLTDIRTDAWFRSASAVAGADFREIAPVSYNQPPFESSGGVTGNWQPARGR